IQVGRILKFKNAFSSLLAIKKFQKRTGRNVKFLLVGEHLDKGYLKEIKENGKGIVTIYKSIPKEELIKLYSFSDIFIMPSFSEIFLLVYSEAMSQGLPIIYSLDQGFD